MKARRLAALALAGGLSLAGLGGSVSWAAAGGVVVASSPPGGGQSNDDSTEPSLSADGTKVAFESFAANLVRGDDNVVQDIFVKDLTTGAVTRASTSSSGAQSTEVSFKPTISADGSKVAFYSYSLDLVPGTDRFAADLFVKDLTTGVLTRVNSTAKGVAVWGSYGNYPMALSADGTKIAFSSEARNLVTPDRGSHLDVFVKDLDTGKVVRASESKKGVQADHGADEMSISADGTRVAFASAANNLGPGKSVRNTPSIFVKNLKTGSVTRASVTTKGVMTKSATACPSISADGTRVAFLGDGADLVKGDTNKVADLFVKNLTSGNIARVSTSSSGKQTNLAPGCPFLSADGKKVGFTSSAMNLVSGGDSNKGSDVFVKTTSSGKLVRVSTAANGAQLSGESFGGSLSAHGGKVVFSTTATDVVAGDTNEFGDVFVKNVP